MTMKFCRGGFPAAVSMVTGFTGLLLMLLLLTAVQSRSQNATTEIWDLPTNGLVPCLQGCSCQVESPKLSLYCLSGDQATNTGANSTSSPSISYPSPPLASLNGALDTNDTISTLGELPHKSQGDLAHYLLGSNVSVTEIYVEGFWGQAPALWDFLSGAGSSIKDIYLKKCSSITGIMTVGEGEGSNSSSLERNNKIKNANNKNITTSPLFKMAPQIRSIALTMGNISVITEDTFDSRLYSLKTINLSGNVISMLNDSSLANLTSLETLNLSHNWLLMANLGCNKPLINLKALDVSFNRIRNLAGVICQDGFPQLKTLDMAHNQIEVLEEGSLEGLSSLRVLDLSSNAIGQIHLGSFGCHLTATLHSLLLQNNSISALHLQVLVPLKRLYRLDVSYNDIQTITGYSANSTTTANGSLGCESQSHELFQSFDNTNTEPPSPAVLNLWPQLTVIDMSHNNITDLPQNVFEQFFRNSRNLFLSHNNINYVPRYGVEHLKGLESIDLSHNLIDWMDVGTFTSPHLRDIDLSHNRLKKVISMTFLYLPNLRRLDLSHNRLNYLYRLALYKTCKYGQDIHLDLTHNHLSEDAVWKFMSTFHEMKNDNCILLLHFQNNRLRYLLDASSRQNFLRALHEDDPQFYHMWAHSVFNMSHNPFHCDCHLHQDISLITEINRAAAEDNNNKDSTDGLLRWENLVCEKPGSFKGVTLKAAESRLAASCELDVLPDVHQYYQDCNNQESVQRGRRLTPCDNKTKKGSSNSNFMVITVIASIGSLAGFITVVFIFKKLKVVRCLTGRGRWYRVYAEENHGNQSVAMYYHPSDRSLVMNELVYFVQDCCPSHDIVLHPSDDINEQMDQPSATFPKTTLFIISRDLVQAIRGSRVVQAHYEAVIEQSQASVFLVMGNRGELELLYPHFWSKVKYRHNVYFVCGTDRLPKLQCVLTNVCGSEDVHVY